MSRPERLGWSNDGAPLRDFPLVAIVQHAPKSLTRMVGADFRVPTDEELDALVAYQRRERIWPTQPGCRRRSAIEHGLALLCQILGVAGGTGSVPASVSGRDTRR